MAYPLDFVITELRIDGQTQGLGCQASCVHARVVTVADDVQLAIDGHWIVHLGLDPMFSEMLNQIVPTLVSHHELVPRMSGSGSPGRRADASGFEDRLEKGLGDLLSSRSTFRGMVHEMKHLACLERVRDGIDSGPDRRFARGDLPVTSKCSRSSSEIIVAREQGSEISEAGCDLGGGEAEGRDVPQGSAGAGRVVRLETLGAILDECRAIPDHVQPGLCVETVAEEPHGDDQGGLGASEEVVESIEIHLVVLVHVDRHQSIRMGVEAGRGGQKGVGGNEDPRGMFEIERKPRELECSGPGRNKHAMFPRAEFCEHRFERLAFPAAHHGSRLQDALMGLEVVHAMIVEASIEPKESNLRLLVHLGARLEEALDPAVEAHDRHEA